MSSVMDRQAGRWSHVFDSNASIWLDHVTPHDLIDGALKRLVDTRGVRGAVIDPDALNGPDLPDVVASWLSGHGRKEGVNPSLATEHLLGEFARDLCFELRDLHEISDHRDGVVCLPLDPRAAEDPSTLLQGARRVAASVAAANLMLEAPDTAAGRRVLQQLTADGVGACSTGATPHELRDVLTVLLSGLRMAHTSGHDIGAIATAVRIPIQAARHAGSEASEAPDGPGPIAALLDAYRQALHGTFWQELATAGARPPRLLLAGENAGNVHEWDHAEDMAENVVVLVDADAPPAVASNAVARPHAEESPAGAPGERQRQDRIAQWERLTAAVGRVMRHENWFT